MSYSLILRPSVPEALFIFQSIFSLFFSLGNFYCRVFKFSDSSVLFCCWVHVLRFLFQVLGYLVLNFHVAFYLCCDFVFLCWLFCLFVCLSFVSGVFVVAHWSILWWLLKSCLVTVTCVMPVFLSIDYLFSFHLRCSWFLLCWENFCYSVLDILGIILWGSRSYLNIMF